MEFKRLSIPDVILCQPKVINDDRGYFMETFRQDQLDNFLGYTINFCQDNESKSLFGIVRGLHYQLPPFAQTKLVRVIQGEVLDVAVDIRLGSPTYGKHVSVVLNAETKNQLLVPQGFAHGFVVMSSDAIIAYKADNYYNFESERGIAFNDSELSIDWGLPFNQLKKSKKDSQNPLFKELEPFVTQN
jgi:dTDP-4-dehydrorhamnose 3,5-epimerase